MRAFNTTADVLTTARGIVGGYEFATVDPIDSVVAAALANGTLVPEVPQSEPEPESKSKPAPKRARTEPDTEA